MIKYHPASKDFQDEVKRSGLTGNQYIQRLIEEGKLPNPTDVERKVREKMAKNAGFDNVSKYNHMMHEKTAKNAGFNGISEYAREQMRNWRWNNGIQVPMSENENCSYYFGIEIAEKYISALFDNPIRMSVNNPGFDWICKKGKRIQNKARCLEYHINRWIGWNFPIKYNNNTDYFIFSGWNNREDLEPMYMWLIHKDDIIRGRKLWRRDSFSITNKPEYLAELKKYEITDKLEKLKEYCNNTI